MEEKIRAFVEPVMAERPKSPKKHKKDKKDEVMSSSSNESKTDKKVNIWKRLTKTIQVSLAELTKETIDSMVPADQ